MKNTGFFIVVTAVLASCNNSSKIEAKADSLSNKIETTAGKVWDSTKAGFKKLKEKVDDKLDKLEDKLDKKDSAKKKPQG